MFASRIYALFICLMSLVSCVACNEANQSLSDLSDPIDADSNRTVKLLYMGQATLRLVTENGKVIYIDPFSGDDYSLSADLILVTHEHFDHNAIDKVKNRNKDCRIIRSRDAIKDGKHCSFRFDYVYIEPVEAGFNRMHDKANCVGYILTFKNGKKVYVSGDTSTTDQMRDGSMAAKEIDYAFLCTDGYYNMDNTEAALAAEMIKAIHTVPYHNSVANDGYNFSDESAEQFNVSGKLIVKPGESIIMD